MSIYTHDTAQRRQSDTLHTSVQQWQPSPHTDFQHMTPPPHLSQYPHHPQHYHMQQPPPPSLHGGRASSVANSDALSTTASVRGGYGGGVALIPELAQMEPVRKMLEEQIDTSTNALEELLAGSSSFDTQVPCACHLGARNRRGFTPEPPRATRSTPECRGARRWRAFPTSPRAHWIGPES